MPKPALQDLQGFLDDITSRMAGVYRWKMYPDRACKDEEVVRHTVQTSMLAIILYELERKFGDASHIDLGRLVAGAVLHDVGEGFGGDVRWDLKQHPIVGPLIEAMEHDYFIREVVGALPPDIRDQFFAYYDLQNEREDPTGRFFNAIEQLGYVIRAIDEYRRGSRKLGLEVIAKQHATFERYAADYPSVKMIYDIFRAEVETICASDEGRAVAVEYEAKRSQHHALHPEDVRALLEKLPEEVRRVMLTALFQIQVNGDDGEEKARASHAPLDNGAPPVRLQ